MLFIKEQFYPQLTKATDNIEDALQNLYMINNVIMQEFLELMKEKKMKDINITKRLVPEMAKFGEMEKLIKLFDDMDVFKAKEIIEGMRQEINLFLTEENKNRTLADLKTLWFDELDKENE